MAGEQYLLGEEAMRQIHTVVRDYMTRNTPVNPGRARWFRRGGSASCTNQNCIMHFAVLGGPTGGTFDVELTVGASTDTMQFNYNDSATAVATELATHTNLTSADVSVSGGPFPDVTVIVEFAGDQANTNIALPSVDYGSLTGGTGVGVLPFYGQTGYPN